MIDLKKLKTSMNHQVSESEGWMRTEFNGGRSKLERKKGFREWWSYRLSVTLFLVGICMRCRFSERILAVMNKLE